MKKVFVNLMVLSTLICGEAAKAAEPPVDKDVSGVEKISFLCKNDQGDELKILEPQKEDALDDMVEIFLLQNSVTKKFSAEKSTSSSFFYQKFIYNFLDENFKIGLLQIVKNTFSNAKSCGRGSCDPQPIQVTEYKALLKFEDHETSFTCQ